MNFLYNNKGFSLIELLVVVAIIGILAAVGSVSYIGYVAGTQVTEAQNNMQAIYMTQEEFRSTSALNNYYSTDAGANCVPTLVDSGSINTNLFGGRAQLDATNNAEFIYCIAEGAANDGGYLIQAQRTVGGGDIMTLNANNAKTLNGNIGW